VVTSAERLEDETLTQSDRSPESALLTAARQALQASPYRPVRSVRCRIEQDRLRLDGRLGSFFHKQLAQEAVARIPGVAGVVNAVEVDG